MLSKLNSSSSSSLSLSSSKDILTIFGVVYYGSSEISMLSLAGAFTFILVVYLVGIGLKTGVGDSALNLMSVLVSASGNFHM